MTDNDLMTLVRKWAVIKYRSCYVCILNKLLGQQLLYNDGQLPWEIVE